MKTTLFIAILLGFIAAGAVVLYKIGEVIVEMQDAVCHGEHGRWRRGYEDAEEDED